MAHQTLDETQALNAMILTDPAQLLARIRRDPVTQLGSVLDVVNLITNCGRNNARDRWERFQSNYPDVAAQVTHFILFPGRGQRETPVATTATLCEIAFLLPGRAARQLRRQGVDVLLRAFGGDPTLADHIMERHAAIGGTEEQATLLQGTSADPQQQVIQQPVLTEEEMALARRERLVNLAIKEAEAAERRANLKTFYMHAIEEERETLRRLGAYNEAIHAQWFRDRALSTVQTDISRLLTDGSASTQDGLTLWTVAHRVQAIGLRFRATQPGERDRAQALGMAVAAEYRRRFNQDPPKIFRGDAPIVVNGSNVAPNGYSNHDCDVWLDEFVRTWIANDNPPVPGAPGPVRRHARRARATTAGNGGTHAPKQGELNSFFRRHGR